ncbi:MAG TPA: PhnD/SsuA/transferrin family substrate-binding protein [Bacteroidota bacterium]|nr:PhnD/SsuA/transferrin family substrate-binding protein [Bacteroidota bacterium]
MKVAQHIWKIVFIGLWLTAAMAVAAPDEAPLRLGVLAYRPKPQTREQWQPVATYLESMLKKHIQLDVYDNEELNAAASRHAVDVVITTAYHYILLRHTCGLSTPLATLNSREREFTLNAYGGVIFTRADHREITSLTDLAGKRIAAVSKDAFGGYQMQSLEFAEAGVPLPAGDKLLLTGQPHDRVIEAVIAGRADAGFIRTGVLESLIHSGKIDSGAVRIINPRNSPTYPFAVSTRLYPEWPVSVMPQIDKELAARLAAALYLLPHDSFKGPASVIHGFEIPANYDGAENLLRVLHLPPFDRTPEVSLADLWRTYRYWIVALIGSLLLLAGSSTGLVFMYRKSRQSLRDVERLSIERKYAEEQIRQFNQELEQRVADRTAQLEAANKELEAFAYSISHNLRAPLRHIDGYIEILRQNTQMSLEEPAQHYMRLVCESAEYMGMLIDDLLSFARMNRIKLGAASVNSCVLVNEVIDSLHAERSNRDIEWRIGMLPVISGDEAMLRTVFINLISNALKFTRCRTHPVIEIGSTDSVNEVTFFIRDNGVGFDMQYAPKLFGVFQRLHRADEFEGTGIGLAKVHRIIERHGGRTWADGKIDEGATFYFSVPKHS